MIPFEFEYVRPASIRDATEIHREATAAGKTVRYMAGGTELVTMARDGKLTYDVLVDLKRIPETTHHDDASLTYGACVRLSELRDRAFIPVATGSAGAGGSAPATNSVTEGAGLLVAATAGGVADRTTRNSITLGGNMCGMLPYRETLLPFLLFDGAATIAGPDGNRTVRVSEVFDRRLKLESGEFVASLHINSRFAKTPVFYRRRTRDPNVDYPLVTLCMARDDEGFRLAVAGVFGTPVRDAAAEQVLNEGAANGGADAARVAAAFSVLARGDLRGTAEYRMALLEQSIREGVEALGGTR